MIDTPQSIPLIFDDDGSQDGMTALAYMLANPKFDVKAITIANGIARPDIFDENIKRMLGRLGDTDIPVGVGRSTPLSGNNEFPDFIRDGSDTFWFPFVDLPAEVPDIESQSAVDLIIDTVNNSPEPVAILATGPLTNIAEALRQDPSIIDNISVLQIMGGAVFVEGNLPVLPDPPFSTNTTAEFNIWVDPVAAQEVFDAGQRGLNIQLTPLDATNQIEFDRDDYQEWLETGTPESEIAAEFLDYALTVIQSDNDPNPVWDLVAAKNLSEPDFSPETPLHIDVDTESDPGATQGQTVAVPNLPPNVLVSLDPSFDNLTFDAGATFSYLELPVVSFSADRTVIIEGGEPQLLTFHLSEPAPVGGLTVNLNIDDPDGEGADTEFPPELISNIVDFGQVEEDGTITASLTIAEGATEATFAIAAIEDDEAEGEETYSLTLLADENYQVDPASTTITTTITEAIMNEQMTTVSITPETLIATEGETFAWNFSLNAPAPEGGLSLSLLITDNNDPAPGDVNYFVEGSSNIAGFEFITSDESISQIYAFGDSYSDDGLSLEISTDAVEAGVPDSFILPADPELGLYDPQGRWTNGETAVEVLAENLGVDLTNYAVGGAKSGDGNYYSWLDSLQNTGVFGQIDQFNAELEGQPADPDALYFIFASANDFFEYADFGLPGTVAELATQTVENIVDSVTDLSELGAEKFLVVNSSDLDILPGVIEFGQAEEAALFVDEVNNLLPQELASLDEELNVNIALYDHVAISDEIRFLPEEYGLTNVDDPYQPVFPVESPPDDNPDEYYFWDEYHPTRRAHEIIGEDMASFTDSEFNSDVSVGFNITIAEGETEAVLVSEAIADDIEEGEEIFTTVIADGENYRANPAQNQIVTTLLEKDNMTQITVSLTPETLIATEGETFAWNFSLDAPAPAGGLSLFLPITLNNDPAPGDADYNLEGSSNIDEFEFVTNNDVSVGFNLTIAEGATEAVLISEAVADDITETDETFTTVIADGVNYVANPEQNSVTTTITELPVVSLLSDEVTAAEGDTFTWDFSLNQPAPEGGLTLFLPITVNNDPAPGDVNYNIEGSSNIADFEFVVEDGVSIGFNLTIAEGATSAALVSEVVADDIEEETEIFTTVIADGENYRANPAQSEVVTTLTESNTSTDLPTISLFAEPTEVEEGSQLLWNFSLTEAVGEGGLTVALDLVEDTDPLPGDITYFVDGSENVTDFELIINQESGLIDQAIVTLAEGATEATLVNDIIADNATEGPESVSFALAESDDYTIDSEDNAASFTILDTSTGETIDPIRENVFGSSGDDLLEPFTGTNFNGNNDLVFAGGGNDLIDVSYSFGENRIYGGSGDDVLLFGSNNFLSGGSGEDQFFAVTGGDNTLVGGSDADEFWILLDSGDLPTTANTIVDFDAGEGDVIGIANTDLTFGSLTLTTDDGSTIVQAFGQDIAILAGVEATELTESDFVFG